MGAVFQLFSSCSFGKGKRLRQYLTLRRTARSRRRPNSEPLDGFRSWHRLRTLAQCGHFFVYRVHLNLPRRGAGLTVPKHAYGSATLHWREGPHA